MGKMLFVDLSSGQITVEEPDDKLYREYIGGYGLGAKILFDRMKPDTDALGPDNILGFVTGPLTGSPALSGSRYTVVCKSPLTGTWGDANSGGQFGPKLKAAGYDAVFFTGAAQNPVYLFINEGQAELRDASKYWGIDSNDLDDMIREEHGKDIEMACIGQSGEKLSLISCVMDDKGRAAGRSGVGAVMGSKKLKAVVAKGKMELPLAHKTKAREVRRTYLKEEQAAPFFQLFHDFGTAGITGPSALSGDSPVKNWGGSGVDDFPNAGEISDVNVIKYQRKRYACWRCNIACGGEMKASSGKYEWTKDAHKPEYETLASFGTMNLIDDVESIIKANDICNRYGLDVISAGSVISFAIECFENGLITSADTGGIELRWGNAEAMVAMLEKLAKREGFGDVLADGTKVASQRIGAASEQYRNDVGGQEAGMHDPKFQPGLAVSFQLDATPGRHTQGGEGNAPVELGLPQIDPRDYESRGVAHKMGSNYTHTMNASGMCMFAAIMLSGTYLVEQMNSVTGWDMDLDEILTIGERIANIRQAFNVRDGSNPLEMFVPGRLNGEPALTSGPLAGVKVDADTMIHDYLTAMDWDLATARPSQAKLLELGLDEVAAQLYPEPAVR
jgi:aldehyde:ferredoxin oxidoreductase